MSANVTILNMYLLISWSLLYLSVEDGNLMQMCYQCNTLPVFFLCVLKFVLPVLELVSYNLVVQEHKK